MILLWLSVGHAQDSGRLSVESSAGVYLVYCDTLLLGTTPLDSARVGTGLHILRCIDQTRSWYNSPVIETVTVAPNEHLLKRITTTSSTYRPAVQHLGGADSLFRQSALEQALPANPLPVYLTTAGAVLSGAAAAYFKVQADNHYNSYLYSGDQQLLDKVKREDIAAGIALAVCQINLVTLTYLLLSR